MDLNEKQLIEAVFAGGGDMGARMRAFDWSTTDLGPVAQWPHSLRAGVRIVLAAGHPMLISWGPDYTMLYNDAYGVVVGTKHPGALGRSCREVRLGGDHHGGDGRAGPCGVARHSHQHAERDPARHRQGRLLRRAGA